MIIGERLKEILKIRKLSAREFAKKIQVSEPMIYKYYKMENVDSRTLKKWAEVLRVPVLYFFDDDAYDYVKANETGTITRVVDSEEERQMNIEFFDYMNHKQLVVPYSVLDKKDQEIKELNREIGRLQARIEQLEEENKKLKLK